MFHSTVEITVHEIFPLAVIKHQFYHQIDHYVGIDTLTYLLLSQKQQEHAV